MTTYTVTTTDGTEATLWSDDTFTLHFGAGFDEQTESTVEELSESVSREDLLRIAAESTDQSDREKAAKAARLTATTYEARMDGASQAIEADSLESAIEQAKDWARDGNWELDGTTIWVHAYAVEIAAGGEETAHSVTVQIDPEEPKCAGGEHDWQSPVEIVGGIKENPGVWGHGGGVTIQSACMKCGCGQLIDTWAQDPETGEQGLRSTTYEPGKYQIPQPEDAE